MQWSMSGCRYRIQLDGGVKWYCQGVSIWRSIAKLVGTGIYPGYGIRAACRRGKGSISRICLHDSIPGLPAY